MNFETLINSPKEVIKEYLEEPKKLKEMGVNLSQLGELIKKAGESITYVEDPEKFNDLLEYFIGEEEYSNYDEETINNFFVELIKNTGKTEEYLKNEEMMNAQYGVFIILAAGKAEEYLNEPEKRKNLWGSDVLKLIKSTRRVEEYLIPEKLTELGVDYENPITELIKATNNPEKYLFEGQYIKNLDLRLDMANIIKGTGRAEEYLTPEKLKELGVMYNKDKITKLIKATNNPEKYLFEGQDIKDQNIQLDMANIIKGTGRIEEYLTPEKLKELGVWNYFYYNVEITELIKATGKIEEYLTPEKLAELGLKDEDNEIGKLIKGTGKIEEYLTPEKLEELGLKNNKYIIAELIKGTGKIEEYLTLEKLEELGLKNNSDRIAELIEATGKIEEYLTQKKLAELGLMDKSVEIIITALKFSYETIKVVTSIDEGRQKDAIEILYRLSRSNSAELRRIKEQMALQILEKEPETYEKTLNAIENIYLTSNVPDVGKLYLVFKELHPNLLGEDTKMQDDSIGNIPSLKEATIGERKSMIFTRLLMSAVESNSRNLRDYIETIEQGNEIFKKIRNGEIKAQNLAKKERETITKYNEILNFVYNQSNKEEKRENTGDIEKDINELAKLFRMDVIEKEMPDRLVRLFAHRAEIRSLEQAKELFENSRKKADEINTLVASIGKIEFEYGDFVKGIEKTEYFPSMLQRGILAKDFLGGDATSDLTPLDTDVEKVTKVGKTFNETLKSLKLANSFTSSDIDGKKFGKIMLVFSKDNFIETRNQNDEVSMENVELLKQDKDKKEVCYNYGTAYGISMGIGSENIKCIVADKYVDKLGLEIALNGFYIPIVDNYGKVIYTKEMYNNFREKMQGLSHYGEKHFELDETARRPEMSGIIELVDRSMQDARNKQEKILKTLEEAVNKNGYTLSDERRTDLKPGIVEYIDTGSTGRGTNMPGDGDFDYMVRMDKVLSDNPTEFKNSLREALRKN